MSRKKVGTGAKGASSKNSVLSVASYRRVAGRDLNFVFHRKGTLDRGSDRHRKSIDQSPVCEGLKEGLDSERCTCRLKLSHEGNLERSRQYIPRRKRIRKARLRLWSQIVLQNADIYISLEIQMAQINSHCTIHESATPNSRRRQRMSKKQEMTQVGVTCSMMCIRAFSL